MQLRTSEKSLKCTVRKGNYLYQRLDKAKYEKMTRKYLKLSYQNVMHLKKQDSFLVFS